MIKLALAATLAASLSTFAVPALAQDVSVQVPYGDLDIATPAGTQVLAQRFDAGVDTACARPDIRDIKAMSEFTSCKDAAATSAAAQLARAGSTLDANQLLALN